LKILNSIESKRNILVLLAGTSGTGKSTLSSLLGSRLGISTVISTDTIRHVMRNFVAKEDDPIIFASTYETAAFVSNILIYKLYRSPKISNQRRREPS
jgi:2-phosphoglycerate kinase